jgi:hypothetical protein
MLSAPRIKFMSNLSKPAGTSIFTRNMKSGELKLPPFIGNQGNHPTAPQRSHWLCVTARVTCWRRSP